MTQLIPAALTLPEDTLWKQYQKLEAQGLRRPALQMLTAFIDALRSDTEQRRIDFTVAFCLSVTEESVTLRSRSGGRGGNDIAVSGVFDKPIVFSLRQPLISEILAPCLAVLYSQNDIRAPYWIAFLYYHLHSLPARLLPVNFPELTENGFLREALRHDPGNQKARTRLIRVLASQLDYALHELPAGVLFGWNGATIEECREWLDSLENFRELVEKQGEGEKYAEAMHRWEFHFRGYADYLTHREQYRNYADYIDRHWKE